MWAESCIQEVHVCMHANKHLHKTTQRVTRVVKEEQSISKTVQQIYVTKGAVVR